MLRSNAKLKNNKINEILNKPPVFDLSSGLSYKALSDLVKVSKKGNSGFGVNVYDNGSRLSIISFSLALMRLKQL
jgi:hypothetical protein